MNGIYKDYDTIDTRYSANNKLRALPYNFTEFGANCMVFAKV